MDNYYNNIVISVIVPVYDSEKSISRAINSIINQKYSNLDIIVIDDGSQDHTGMILDDFMRRDSRIRVFHVENGGEGKARNLGIKKAKGDYIAFCDADDYMHPDMLLKMINRILIDDSEVAICSWRYVDEKGKILPWKTPSLKTCCLSQKDISKHFFTSINIEGFCWNKLFSADLYKRKKVKYYENKLSFCDIMTNYHLLTDAYKISYIEEGLYDYYQLSTACTHTINIQKEYDFLDVCKELQSISVENNKKDFTVYVVNRIHKQLYQMKKNKSLYDINAYNKYYINAYESFLDISFLIKMYISMKYIVDGRIKQVLKNFIIYAEYINIKKSYKKWEKYKESK